MNRTKTASFLKIHQYSIFLFGTVLLSFGYRLFLMRYRFTVNYDEVNYIKLAASGALYGFSEVFHPFWPPLYPFLVSLVSKMITNFELAGRLFSILCGSLILIPLFYYVRKNYSMLTACLTVSLMMFYPSFAFLSTAILTESLYTLLTVTGIILGWFALNDRKPIKGLLAGILFGLAYLTRPEGIGLLIVYIFICIFIEISLFIKRKSFRYSLLIIFVLAGFTITASPYFLYLHSVTGKWTLSAKGKSLQQGLAILFTDKQEEGEVYRLLSDDNRQLLIDQMFHTGDFLQAEEQRGKPIVKITPRLVIQKYIRNLYNVLNESIPRTLSFFILFFALFGLFGEVLSKKRALQEIYILLFIGFFWFLLIPFFFVSDRYLVPLVPFFLIWASKGMEVLCPWIVSLISQMTGKVTYRYSLKNLALGITLAVLVFGTFIPQLGKIFIRKKWSGDYWADPIEQKIAGEWLKEYSSTVPVIMSRNHVVDYYAGNYNIKESVSVPQNSIERVLEYANYRNVDFIVLNERYKKDYPKLSHLFIYNNIPANLKLIYSKTDLADYKTVIYQVVKK